MGRTGQVGGRAAAPVVGLASLAVLAAGVTVALTRGETPLAQAVTTAADAGHATWVAPDGSARPLVDGQRLAAGAVVRTASDGSVSLVTRGRVVRVGPGSAVVVTDGARQHLLTGTAVVDSAHGPGLHLTLAGDSLDVPTGSATEAQRTLTVRVGALSGPARLTSDSGRRLVVPSLRQVAVGGDALPTATTVLHLSDSAAEAATVPALVGADVALRTLATGIDSAGPAAAAVVTASWTGRRAGAGPGAPRSERVLPVVIADATPASRSADAQQRYDRVVAGRRAGGSWGVLLAELHGRSAAVLAMLTRLQRSSPAGRVGTVTTRTLDAAARASATAGPAPSGSPGATTPRRRGSAGSHHRGTTTSHHRHHSRSGGSGAGSPGTVGSVTTTVKHVVRGIKKLLPVLPSTPASPTPTGLLHLGH